MNLPILKAHVAISLDFTAAERDFLLYAIRMSAVTALCAQARKKEKALTREGQGSGEEQ